MGKKAVFVPGNNSRRNADVLIAEQFRRYYSLRAGFARLPRGCGVLRQRSAHRELPEAALRELHRQAQSDEQQPRRMVRAFKNTRNVMIENGALAEVIVPSYFLEWMLYNVPNKKFTVSYTSMLVECFNRAVSLMDVREYCQTTTGR